MKKTENVNLLILGSRTDPGFITMLNKMLWSATGASKPMDQKSYIYIFFCNSKFWFLIILFLLELLFYSIFFLIYTYKDSFV
jgi:hypothetical protein